jgi:hypothetical protein
MTMSLENATVVEVRRLTDAECKDIGVPIDNLGNPRCLVLNSDAVLFPVSDRAMNSGGGWKGDSNRMENLEGKRIEGLEPMSDKYMRYLDWNNIGEKPTVISFSNGYKIYPSKDEEGNGPGLLFEYENQQLYEIVFS